MPEQPVGQERSRHDKTRVGLLSEDCTARAACGAFAGSEIESLSSLPPLAYTLELFIIIIDIIIIIIMYYLNTILTCIAVAAFGKIPRFTLYPQPEAVSRRNGRH